MSDPGSDPTVQRLRDEISEVDQAILEYVNARLDLVTRLRRHKASLGIPFVDADRERELLAELAGANSGPLSDDGLRAFFGELLELTKREVTQDDGRQA